MSEVTITPLENGDLQIHVPMRLKTNRGRKQIIMPEGLDGEIPDADSPVQSALAQAVCRSYAWTKMIESGEISSPAEVSRRVNLDPAYVRRILKLSALDPEITEAILNGEEPEGLSWTELARPFPALWEEQEGHFTDTR